MSTNVVPLGILDRNKEALSEQPDPRRLTQYVLDETDPKLGAMRCSLFTLVHVSGDFDPVQSWLVPKGCSEAERTQWAQRIGSECDEMARNTASTLPFKQSFKLTATIGSNATDHPKGGWPFVATPPPEKARGFAENAGKGARGEALDANSVVGNLTRTLDVFTQTFAETVLGVIDRQSQELGEEREWRLKAMARIDGMWQQREIDRDASAERQAKLENSTMWADAQRDALKLGMDTIKQGVGKWMEGVGIARLVKTLKAEQVCMLFHSTNADPAQRKEMQGLVNGIMLALPAAERDKVCEMMGWRPPPANLPPQTQQTIAVEVASASAPPPPPESPTPPPPPVPEPQWEATPPAPATDDESSDEVAREQHPPLERPCASGSHGATERCEYCTPAATEAPRVASDAAPNSKRRSKKGAKR